MLKIIFFATILMFAAGLLWSQTSAKKSAPKTHSANDGPPNVTGTPVKTEDGLEYWEIKVGTGSRAIPGDIVQVNYTGWLVNGKKFDSSLNPNEPFTFQLGHGDVIKGWDEGIQGMRVGGKRRLRIPSALGYGAEGAGGDIPPNATLIFDVELLGTR